MSDVFNLIKKKYEARNFFLFNFMFRFSVTLIEGVKWPPFYPESNAFLMYYLGSDYWIKKIINKINYNIRIKNKPSNYWIKE